MNVWAPGRINLIGEHTDYSGGLALPAAIELGLNVCVRARLDAIRLSSQSFGEADPFAADGSGDPVEGWARLGQSVAAELDRLGRPPVGLTATISSTLPAGVGLSSSAALEVGIALALCAVADYHVEPLELAQACRRAEQRAVGVPCGILDQAACIFGDANSAILIDCATSEHAAIPIAPDAAFLVVDSGITRRLEHTAYALRRRELETALVTAGAASPRELTREEIELLEAIPAQRLRHVITENERVTEFAAALEGEDLPMAGRVMSASHASLRDDYEVSLPEIDRLVAKAEEAGALGARLIGGGFGGAVLALSEASRANELACDIRAASPTGNAPIVVHASGGARIDAP
jgi:galactokinase